MVTAVLGPERDVYAYCSQVAPHHGEALWLPCPTGKQRSWGGIRAILDQASSVLGKDRVDDVLNHHRVAASFLVGRVREDLSTSEQAERERLRARFESHLSHNWAIRRALLDGWSDLLHDLLCKGHFTLVVPHLGFLDLESARALKSLYRRHEASAPDLVVGYDFDLPMSSLDERGLAWRMDTTLALETFWSFQSISGTETVRTSHETTRSPLPDTEPKLAWPDDAEHQAFGVLAAAASPEMDQEAIRLVVAAQTEAFERFGFTSALRLGLELLDRGPELDSGQLARVHGVIGLSAHNRQFRSRGNSQLADFLAEHFSKALSRETHPLRRRALLYRLAVTHGRRKGDLIPAMEYADRALEELQGDRLPPSSEIAYQNAWAYNVRSLIYVRQRKIDNAIADCEEASQILKRSRNAVEKAHESAGEEWTRDLIATQSLIANNLAALAWMKGSRGDYEHWHRQATALEKGQDGVLRFDAGSWIGYYRSGQRPDLALKKALEGVRGSKAERDVAKTYRFLLESADLSYRVGKAHEAADLYRESKNLRRHLGNPRFLEPADLCSVTALMRAGASREAEAILIDALAEKRAPEERADILTTLGILCARVGRGRDADLWIDEAIELSSSLAERDLVLRVAVSAGVACRSLRRSIDMREAFQRAVEIAETGAEEPPAGTLLMALVGLAESTGDDPAVTSRALRLLPSSLQDPEAWWELTRLLRLVYLASDGHSDVLDSAEAADRLVLAATQRTDCLAGPAKEYLAGLRQMVGQPSGSATR